MAAVNIWLVPGYTKVHLFVFWIVADIVMIALSIGAYVSSLLGMQGNAIGIAETSAIAIVVYALLYPLLSSLLRYTESNQIYLKKRHVNFPVISHPHADSEVHSQTNCIDYSQSDPVFIWYFFVKRNNSQDQSGDMRLEKKNGEADRLSGDFKTR